MIELTFYNHANIQFYFKVSNLNISNTMELHIKSISEMEVLLSIICYVFQHLQYILNSQIFEETFLFLSSYR